MRNLTSNCYTYDKVARAGTYIGIQVSQSGQVLQKVKRSGKDCSEPFLQYLTTLTDVDA